MLRAGSHPATIDPKSKKGASFIFHFFRLVEAPIITQIGGNVKTRPTFYQIRSSFTFLSPDQGPPASSTTGGGVSFFGAFFTGSFFAGFSTGSAGGSAISSAAFMWRSG